MVSRADRGAAEYAALVDALEEVTPRCRDDARFILERAELAADDLTDMRAMCALCPLLAACGAYGTAARPPAGMWAGHLYNNAKKGDSNDR